ncbi:MAG: glycosyl transferase group 1 [Acidobacteria bacterium]|jgi:glycosyltransferase involved in cell wall biosynthesis|nr:glycosyl transferase group 1 [Acidobacteriota bacterium]
MRQIIYAWNYLEWGGAQIHLLAIMKEARKEFDVIVVLPEGSNQQFISFLDEENIKYEFFKGHITGGAVYGLKNKFNLHKRKFISERAMLRHLEKFDLSRNIVHIDLSPQQSIASLISLSLRTRVFITAHNALPPASKWRDLLWKLKFKAISQFKNFKVFCSNRDAKEYFKKYYTETFGNSIKITYTSINPPEIDSSLEEKLDRDLLLEKYDLPKKKFIVLCVGQFIDRKGRWTFLDAAKIVCQKTDDVIFVWVSNSKPNAEDLLKAEEYGLGEKFRLIMSDQVGKERKDLFRLFRLADVFTLPSFVEGLPISLLEAMALGIPSISTNVYAIPEAVKNLETGILIEPGDVSGLSNGILSLKNDDVLRKRLSENGRRWVLDNFDERQAARVAINAYKESLGE